MNLSLKSLREILYPRRCALCDAPLSRKERYVCGGCRRKLRFVREPVCMKCGKPMADSAKEYCRDCSRTSHYYVRGFAPFVYRGDMRASVVRFKYAGRGEYAAFYARAMGVFGEYFLKAWKPEALIPVPVHPSRLIKRGYNQAVLLAEELSKLTGIPADDRLVIRRVKTAAQKELDVAERRKNLARAFACSESCPYRRVLVVDDIYTSGSTADALALLLLSAGAEEVYFASVCIGAEDC